MDNYNCRVNKWSSLSALSGRREETAIFTFHIISDRKCHINPIQVDGVGMGVGWGLKLYLLKYSGRIVQDKPNLTWKAILKSAFNVKFVDIAKKEINM